MPTDASSAKRRVRHNNSDSQTVKIPVAAAPRTNKGEVRSFVKKKAATMPKRTVCVMASAVIDIRLKTKNTPGMLQATETTVIIESISVCAFIRYDTPP